jgi:hypothetical protein
MFNHFRVTTEKRSVFCADCRKTIPRGEKHLRFVGAAAYYRVSKRLCKKCLLEKGKKE